MILDSSAVVSVIEEEDGHDGLLEALAAAPVVAIGAPTQFEAGMILVAREGLLGYSALSLFLAENEVVSIPFEDRHRAVALDAFIRFGKGRHPARLNYGDCMAYATARLARLPLLCIGGDFARTDLPLARPGR